MRGLYFDPRKLRPLRHRVVAAGMEGVTPQESGCTESHATHETVASDGFFDEVGAGRLEAAGLPEER